MSATSSRWDVFLQEKVRGYATLLPAAVVSVLVTVAARRRAGSLDAVGSYLIEQILLVLAAYLLGYVVLTVLAFGLTPARRYLPWAQKSRLGGWRQQLAGSRPGAGMAVGVSAVALVVGVFWLPHEQAGALLSPLARVVLAVVLVLGAWLTVVLTYSVAYLCHDAASGYRSLLFPGKGQRRWTDYLYLSAGISTSFATTDVQVLDAKTRRMVVVHSVVAFGFNTVILAAIVSVLLR